MMTLIEEIADFLVENKGPVEGRCHPRRKQVCCSDLEAAIALSEKRGLPKGLRPYHVRGTISVWDNVENVDEVLTKKIDQLLETTYDGNLVTLITSTNKDELLSPLTDVVNGQNVNVSMGQIGNTFRNSPFEMVCRYIELKGLEKEFLGIRPYHFKHSGSGTFDDSDTVDMLLARKIDQLLETTYDGNLVKLITSTRHDELVSPLTDVVNGQNVNVSMGKIGIIFRDSPFDMVYRYIEVKGLEKEFWGIRPYHFKHSRNGTFDDSDTVDMLLARKIDQLLETTYDGNLVKLITSTNYKELLSPLTDVVNGQTVNVSMSQIGHIFRDSPFEMVCRYIELKGLEQEFLGIRPYHFRNSGRGTFDDQDTVDTLLARKIDQLLETTYDGNLVTLITSTNQKELLSPLTDVVNGQNVNVSMGKIGIIFRDSPFDMVCRYIEVKGLEKEFWGIRPYHFKHSRNGTFDDQDTVDTLLARRIDQLLETTYDGNLVKLITSTNHKELLSPLTDVLNGQNVNVSMIRIGYTFRNSPFEMVCQYIEINGLEKEFWGIRPYHFMNSGRGTFDDSDTVDMLLARKIDQLLETTYDGNLVKLITSTKAKELFSPLTDVVNGQNVNVSMNRIGKIFRCSPFEVVCRYIELKGLEKEFWGLRPYHLRQSGKDTFEDSDTVDILLARKIDQLLETTYDGNLVKLITSTTIYELVSPLTDALNGQNVNVSMGKIGHIFRGSPFEMLKRYHRIRKKCFPYSQICFIGTSESRLRRISGNLNRYDLSTISEGGMYDTSLLGFRAYSGEDKDVTREMIAESYLEILGEEPVRYLGLESETFNSLSMFAEELNYDASQSTVVEKNPRVYAAMVSLQRHATNGLKRVLEGLEIRTGNFFEVVEEIEGVRTLVNLDTCGHFSGDKEKYIGALFRRRLFADKAMLFVTLDDSGVGRFRAKRAGFENQARAVNTVVLEDARQNGYTVNQEFSLDYFGGTGRNKRPMLLLGYSISTAA